MHVDICPPSSSWLHSFLHLHLQLTQTNNTPAAPANAPATPIIFCCPFTPTGAAAAELCVAAPLPLALLELAALALLALALLLLLCALAKLALALDATLAGTELLTTTVAVLNSVGIVVLNSSVMEATGARPVVEGVLVPMMLVSGCWELPRSDSVETSTLKGWVCAQVAV